MALQRIVPVVKLNFKANLHSCVARRNRMAQVFLAGIKMADIPRALCL